MFIGVNTFSSTKLEMSVIIKSVSMREPGGGVIMFKSRISLKLGTIDGCGEILSSTKNKVTILNSLGFTGTPLRITKSTHFYIIN